MTELEDFLPSIMPYAPGCPEPVAFSKIIKAAQRFCERTRLWRDYDSFELTGDGCNILCAPDGADIYEIEGASVDGVTLDSIAHADLKRMHPRYREDDGSARYISQSMPNSVIVAPGKATGTLQLGLILRPSNKAEALPDFLAQQYMEEIADGALAEILMLPLQSFTDPQTAQFRAVRFASKLDELSNRNIKGQQRAPARTRPRFL